MDDITVIVCTYNGTIESILVTIESIIKQKGIHVNLIVADDGSNDNHEDEIVRYLDRNEFRNYTLLMSKQNRGTVKSICDALNHVSTEYVKFIGQGDLIYDESSLLRVVEFMRKDDYGIAFGKMAGYNCNDGKLNLVERFSPLDINSYIKQDYRKIISEFFLFLNGPCGAIQIYKTDIAKKYMNEIVGHVKYCEDNVLGLFLIDGGKLGYFRDFIVWYEVGNGISSTKDCEIKNMFRIDQTNCFDYMAKIRHCPLTIKSAKMHDTNLIKNPFFRKIMKILCSPSILWFRIKCKWHENYTRRELNMNSVNKTFIEQCFNNSKWRC